MHGSAEIEASTHQVSTPYQYYQAMYMYDRLTFSSSLKWNKALNTLVNQSYRSLGYIFKLDYMCGGLPLNLYDKLVVPVLCYGSWGYERHENIERAHNKFCK